VKYFEDYNFRLTRRLGKIAILGLPPRNGSTLSIGQFIDLENPVDKTEISR